MLLVMIPDQYPNYYKALEIYTGYFDSLDTVNPQILAAIKFGVSQNIVIYVNLAAIKFGVSPRPVCVVYDRRICWRRQMLAKTCNSRNITARQNLLIYSIMIHFSYPSGIVITRAYCTCTFFNSHLPIAHIKTKTSLNILISQSVSIFPPRSKYKL